MGRIRDEWRRFRQRRLGALTRLFKRRRPAAASAPPVPEDVAPAASIDPLLVALLRSELRRRRAGGGPAPAVPAGTAGSEVDALVTAMLAEPATTNPDAAI